MARIVRRLRDSVLDVSHSARHGADCPCQGKSNDGCTCGLSETRQLLLLEAADEIETWRGQTFLWVALFLFTIIYKGWW
jgi:hypothetical protein